MNPIILPAPATPTREQLEYYRDQKLLNRRLAHNIDMLQHSRYVTGTRMMQIDRLVADLAAREAALSPLGNRICIALMRIPDIVDQTAVELRYLDLLSYDDVGIELGCSSTTARHRIRRAMRYMDPLWT